MTTTPNQTTREEISGELDRAVDRIMGVEVAAMNGDNLAVTLCTAFDDPDQEADSEEGWTPAAIEGYEQVCAAIRALFDPVVQSLAALQSPTDREGDRLEWRPIESYEGHGAVLVSRPTTAREAFSATTAFFDATNVWRVFRSKGGMTPLPFKPTHWMPLPEAPTHLSRSIVGEGE
jgi:hypothetical protein